MIDWLRRGAPASWIALAALALSVVATAGAAGVVIDSTRDVANGTLVGADVADGSVVEGDLTGNYSEEVAGEVIYARVTADGNVDEPRSRGIVDANVRRVTSPGRTAYCFSGLGFAPRVATVTPEIDNDRDDAAPSIERGAGTEGCPSGTQLSVVMIFERRANREALPTFERAAKPFYLLIVK